MSGRVDPLVMPPDPLNVTEVEVFKEASDRLAGAMAAMLDASSQFPSRALSLAITHAEYSTLMLRQAAPEPFCRECGNPREFDQEVPHG